MQLKFVDTLKRQFFFQNLNVFFFDFDIWYFCSNGFFKNNNEKYQKDDRIVVSLDKQFQTVRFIASLFI